MVVDVLGHFETRHFNMKSLSKQPSRIQMIRCTKMTLTKAQTYFAWNFFWLEKNPCSKIYCQILNTFVAYNTQNIICDKKIS